MAENVKVTLTAEDKASSVIQGFSSKSTALMARFALGVGGAGGAVLLLRRQIIDSWRDIVANNLNLQKSTASLGEEFKKLRASTVSGLLLGGKQGENQLAFELQRAAQSMKMLREEQEKLAKAPRPAFLDWALAIARAGGSVGFGGVGAGAQGRASSRAIDAATMTNQASINAMMGSGGWNPTSGTMPPDRGAYKAWYAEYLRQADAMKESTKKTEESTVAVDSFIMAIKRGLDQVDRLGMRGQPRVDTGMIQNSERFTSEEWRVAGQGGAAPGQSELSTRISGIGAGFFNSMENGFLSATAHGENFFQSINRSFDELAVRIAAELLGSLAKQAFKNVPIIGPLFGALSQAPAIERIQARSGTSREMGIAARRGYS